MARPIKYISRPTPIEAMRIPKKGEPNAVPDSMDAYLWVESHVGSFEPLAVLDHLVEAPKWGISIDPTDGRFILAQPKGLQWGNDGDWICRSDSGKFFFCPHNFFVGKYEEIKDN